jgi:Fe-S oxidoreductase
MRQLAQNLFGIAAQRPLPPYALERFDHWFARRPPKPSGQRGRVYLWDDTFARYHEPHIAQAAVAVLEAAGFSPALVAGRKCCGRPAFSQGCLDQAAALGRRNLELLTAMGGNEPVLFLEPSCYSMFAEDYLELKLPGAARVKSRCFLFEEFLDNLLGREPGAIRFNSAPEKVAIHAHCHAKSLLNPAFMTRVIERMPGRSATLLDTGCCGMAGAFGALAGKYELSVKIAQPLLQQVQAQPAGSVVIASGTSCRHQLEHLSHSHPRHIAEVLAAGLANGR